MSVEYSATNTLIQESSLLNNKISLILSYNSVKEYLNTYCSNVQLEFVNSLITGGRAASMILFRVFETGVWKQERDLSPD